MLQPASFTRMYAAPVWYPATPWRLRTLSGLGTSTPGDASSIAAVAAQGAATTGGILAGLSAMGTLSPMFAIAGPIGAAVAGLTAVGIAIAGMFSGCGDTCVETTKIVNTAEPLLRQNLQQYMSAPIHYASMQAAALNNYDTVWAAVIKACNQTQYGAAGQACVSDRQAGACTLKTPSGQCWNWFVGYRDPIANDPNVVPDPTPAQVATSGASSSTSASTSVSSFPTPLLLGGAAIALFLLLGGGGNK